MEREEQIRLEEEGLLTFLKRTADGEYAAVERTSLPYVRIEAQTETISNIDECYYYSIS